MKLLNFLILTLGIILLFSCRKNVTSETSDIPQDTVKGNWKMEGWMGKWKFEPYSPDDTLSVYIEIIDTISSTSKPSVKISNGINEIIMDTIYCYSGGYYRYCYEHRNYPTSFYRRNTLYSLEVKIDTNKYLKGYFYTPNIDSIKIISPDSVPKNTSFTIRWQFFGVPSSYDSLYLWIWSFDTTCLAILLPGNTTQYTTTLIDPCKNSDTILIGVGYIRKKIFVDTTKRFYSYVYRLRPFKTY
jgi:hypothetical protein